MTMSQGGHRAYKMFTRIEQHNLFKTKQLSPFKIPSTNKSQLATNSNKRKQGWNKKKSGTVNANNKKTVG